MLQGAMTSAISGRVIADRVSAVALSRPGLGALINCRTATAGRMRDASRGAAGCAE